MARQRKSAPVNGSSTKSKPSRSENNSSSSTTCSKSSQPTQSPKTNHDTHDHSNQETNRLLVMTKWRMIFGCSCLAIASYFGYIGYLETRVTTPFDDQKMVQNSGLDDADRYWGSYRTGVYFGLSTRDAYSLKMGLMWFSPMRIQPGGQGIRHLCDSSDELDKYGWTHHDGRTFGVQTIEDFPFILQTSFVKFPRGQYGGDWTSRISVKRDRQSYPNEILSLIWYTVLDDKTSGIITTSSDGGSGITGIRGETAGLGEFKLELHKINGTIIHMSHLSTLETNLKDYRQIITSNLRLIVDRYTQQRFIALSGEILQSADGDLNHPNFIAHMISGIPPFTVDITYQSISGVPPSELDSLPKPPIGTKYTNILDQKIDEFSVKFEEKFKLKKKGYANQDVSFAEAALSNMIGGIGYFYGSSRVQSAHTKEPVSYWKAPLYTAVPSRSFFPRGFLWDEGFHGLLISAWNVDIELDIVSHWFDLMNVEGWIPREQILGQEALARVPEEFVTQRNTNANPPTFFLTIKSLLNRQSHALMEKSRLAVLERLYPRLEAWFAWYNTTQRGDTLGTYRWRGRDSNSINELNPKTLTSGLDDYPRASHPNDQERHVDLRCWLAYAAGVMAELAHLLGRDDLKYWETHYYLSDNSLLNEMHLSPFTETYSDWGLHTDSVTLKWPQSPAKNRQNRINQVTSKIRVSLKDPEFRFVDTTFGYVSLFPFLLEILTPDSEFLGKLLANLRDPNVLWTEYGLRSLSKSSPLYNKRNTQDDPPYWRGQIWININYLALKALHHYGSQPGPYNQDARRVYMELRHNLVQNVIAQYNRSGYIWERYSDETGEGLGCKPFTGWSALVVLIMSEQY